MSAFDKVIGYETIKNELLQICDMVHNKERYEALGAKLPQGILLYGDPGLGKTLIAKCFIEESGLKSYVVRRNKGNDDFISNITETFQKAKENAAPCIVFLDDMDKFANEDSDHRDAEEYVAVQSGIDEVFRYLRFDGKHNHCRGGGINHYKLVGVKENSPLDFRTGIPMGCS